MEPMFLRDVESAVPRGPHGEAIRRLRDAGQAVPQILHLFAYKPESTGFLSQFTQAVMRGPSPLAPGQRELIAAFTSRRNRCPY